MTISIVPLPVQVRETGGEFVFHERTPIHAGPGTEHVAAMLRTSLAPAMGLPLPIGAPQGNSDSGAVRLLLDPALAASSYTLDVAESGVRIVGGDSAGLFHGIQTLRQLLPVQVFRRTPVRGVSWRAPGVHIEDTPRFAWRGFMLDTARHFFGRDLVFKLIDTLALHRFNVLHLHLTDDQGWRIQINRYPRLTDIGSWRAKSMLGPPEEHRPPEYRYDNTPHSGYFTQDDIREIVAYAADRYIAVVPEIDTPGHSQAAIAAYSELGNTNQPVPVWIDWGINPHVLNVDDTTIEFYRNVFTEVLELFPSTYIHVGGDECPKHEWQTTPKAQAKMGEFGLSDEDELQSWFIRQFDNFLTTNGRRLIGWDEILQGGLAPGATVMSWRGQQGGIAAAKAGHDVVMAPNDHTYLQWPQTDDPTLEPPGAPERILPLRTVYDYEPIPASLTDDEASHILGTQCQMWTEWVQSHRHLEQMIFPRLCAFAERAWGTPKHGYQEFLARLRLHIHRLHTLDHDVFPIDR